MLATIRDPGGLRRRRRRRWPGGAMPARARFCVLTALLVAAVSLVLVPVVTTLLESMVSYDDVGYTPRDFARPRSITSRGVADIFSGTEGYFSVVFLLLCAFFFMRSRKD
jgi:hypothetical protein